MTRANIRFADSTVADHPMTISIVEHVAATTGRDAVRLPPIYECIDPDAVESLVESAENASALALRFTYADRIVTVDGSGTVEVTAEIDRTTDA